MNCIQPSAPAEETFRFVPKAVSILLMPARTCQGIPYSVPQDWKIGSRKGGISKESITELGTPIGAGPNWATVRLGLVGAGEPSGLRRAGLEIFWRSPLATALAPLPFWFCLPKRPLVAAPVLPFLPPELPLVVVVVEVVPLVVVPPPLVRGPAAGSRRSHRWGRCTRRRRWGRYSPDLRGRRGRPRRCRRGRRTARARCGASVPGAVTVRPSVPTETELALPAAIIARAPPSAMMTRSFFLIG